MNGRPSDKEETAPGEGAALQKVSATEDSITSTADGMPITELKSGGIIRVNRARRVLATCVDCPAAFVNTGTAASHSRSARHRVEVDYQSRFAFIPGEVLAELVPR